MTESWKGLAVFSERDDVAFELLSVGRRLAGRLGTDVTAIDLGQEQELDAHRWYAQGADAVVRVRSAQLESPRPETRLEAIARVVQQTRPEVLLVGATASGLEVSARLAQRLGVGCVSECVDIECENGDLFLLRRTMGKFIARERLRSRPAIVTIPQRRFEASRADEGRTGSFLEIPMELPPSRTRLIESERRAEGESPIEEASIIVSVGRGLRRREDLELIARLAGALGGTVAGSRPMTDDLRWLPANVKVGLSGRTVRPDLYLACGISGQVEHIVGMRDARVVVAINTDPDAPIMEEADYQVVGDLYDVLPALIEAR